MIVNGDKPNTCTSLSLCSRLSLSASLSLSRFFRKGKRRGRAPTSRAVRLSLFLGLTLRRAAPVPPGGFGLFRSPCHSQTEKAEHAPLSRTVSPRFLFLSYGEGRVVTG